MIHYRGTQTTGREQAQARRRRTKPIARPTKAAKLAAWGRPNSGLAKTSVVLSEARRASFSSFVGSSGELTNTQLTMPVEAPVAAQVERRAKPIELCIQSAPRGRRDDYSKGDYSREMPESSGEPNSRFDRRLGSPSCYIERPRRLTATWCSAISESDRRDRSAGILVAGSTSRRTRHIAV